MSPGSESTLTLYTYPLSSCAARTRLALSYKSLPYTSQTIDTRSGSQFGAKYSALNPSASVPTLVIHYPSSQEGAEGYGADGKDVVLGQSWSILEYLDEAFPDLPALLPKDDPAKRAVVRELAMVIVSDTQPVTNTRVFKSLISTIKTSGGIPTDETTATWARHYYSRGLSTYEKLCSRHAGKYSVGDSVTLADVCLLPAIWNHLRVDGELEEWPTLKRVYKDLMGEAWVKKEDTSAER